MRGLNITAEIENNAAINSLQFQVRATISFSSNSNV